MSEVTKWQLKKGCDKRVRALHPWVFSNEIASSLKTIQPGSPIILNDINDQFVAYGYGNPNSNICFRAISYEPYNGTLEDLIFKRVFLAWQKRFRLGLKNSYRLCFSENDFLSGLIVDYYHIEQNGKTGQVFAIQISSYGVQKAIGQSLKEFFKKLTQEAHQHGLSPYQWSHTCVVLRNDINARKLEGLQVDEPLVIKDCPFFDLNKIDIRLTTPHDQKHLLMQVDLVNGQKTGFFLDQTKNIELLLTQLLRKNLASPIQKLKILDLCCYVGHWSSQIAYFANQNNIELDVTLADISKTALEFAKENVSKQNPKKMTLREMDVFEDLKNLDESFDIVICDPPALIKNKKGIPTGQHAYFKLNSQAMSLVAQDGMMVSCSCSGLLLKEDLLQIISRASRRTLKTPQIVTEGGHGPDHPHLPSFPEGFYLKMFLLNF